MRYGLSLIIALVLALALMLPSPAVYAAPPPTVTSITPGGGTVAGGTTLTIIGTGFVIGAKVTVGGYAASAVTLTGTTHITARTPPHTTGSAAIVVTNPDAQSGTSPTTFVYTARTSIAPAITEYPIPTIPSYPEGITTGQDGNLWFTEDQGNKIGRITPTGTITEFTVPTVSSTPSSIAMGPDGNLWFTELNGSRIGRITTSGTVTEFSAGITVGSHPGGIVAGADGNLWFTEYGINSIGRITPSGAVIAEYPIPTVNSNPVDIAAGPDGTLWFTEYNANQIGRITTTGVVTEYGESVGNPYRIAAGPDGNVWFTRYTGNDIVLLEPDQDPPIFVLYPVSAGSGPIGITAGPEGDMWFTENDASRIGRITTSGTVTEFSAGITGGSAPYAITTGPGGNLWFTERAGGRISRAVIVPPVVTATSPRSSPTTGGTTVTLIGTGFLAGASVSFGGVLGMGVIVVSDTQITVTAPAHAATGTVDIVVTNLGGGTGTLVQGFTYGTPNPLPGAQPTTSPGVPTSPLPPPRPTGTTGGQRPNPLPVARP